MLHNHGIKQNPGVSIDARIVCFLPRRADDIRFYPACLLENHFVLWYDKKYPFHFDQGDAEMKIQESGENYLEAILILKNENGAVRSIDIVQRLAFTKPSISRAMSLLRKNGLITMDKSGYIELTDSGLEIAERIYERHQLLTRFLTALGVTDSVAAADACRIEHVLSQESFDHIKKHALNVLLKDSPDNV